MTSTVEIPIWLFVLILLFAAVTFASHFLFPSVRWFLRRRAERVVARLNARLSRPIEPFKLLRRQDTIQRLLYDPKVIEAVAEYAATEGVREDVAFEMARRYAREIVPSFSATAYFGFAIRAARLLASAFYRVRVGHFDHEADNALRSSDTVIFVMNHRSNMDYVLVTFLASDRSALSFAAGEWARVWPLGALVRAMGAYFVRRRSGNPLYRRVMARYVQIATRAGVAQAIFPEGGLSLDGAVGAPKLGLLSYILEDFDPDSPRDVVFVPVGLNYDRVLEDRVLVQAGVTGNRRFRLTWKAVLRYLFRHFWQRATGTFLRFGYAAVNFGKPVSLRQARKRFRGSMVEELGDDLTQRVRALVPVTPIPLVCHVLMSHAAPRSRAELATSVLAALQDARDRDVPIVPMEEPDEVEIEIALNHLTARRLVLATDDGISIAPSNRPMVAYYARTIQHHFSAPA